MRKFFDDEHFSALRLKTSVFSFVLWISPFNWTVFYGLHHICCRFFFYSWNRILWWHIMLPLCFKCFDWKVSVLMVRWCNTENGQTYANVATTMSTWTLVKNLILALQKQRAKRRIWCNCRIWSSAAQIWWRKIVCWLSSKRHLGFYIEFQR